LPRRHVDRKTDISLEAVKGLITGYGGGGAVGGVSRLQTRAVAWEKIIRIRRLDCSSVCEAGCREVFREVRHVYGLEIVKGL